MNEIMSGKRNFISMPGVVEGLIRQQMGDLFAVYKANCSA
jgi:hypothetical protein